MVAYRSSPRATALAAGLLLLSLGCGDQGPGSLTGPSAQSQLGVERAQNVRAAIAAQERHSAAMLRIPGVVGTAVGLLPNGRAVVRIFLTDGSVRGLPAALDGVPVEPRVTGRFVARSDPTTRQRPAPLGFSVGHPSITAGTIGARVRDGSGNVYILSNNHVLANSNDASIGDPTLQPGPFDGGTAADQIAILAAFNPIDFSTTGANTMDAAIALSSTSELGSTTPADDGYGAPSSTIFGDADGDGMFDDESALLELAVQKYGRTTKLTQGQITGINGTLTVCYEVLFIFCVKSATFVDQLVIEPGGFSGGGDSGALIVTGGLTRSPVGLLFAGSGTQTIANRIDLVLNHFGVAVDGGVAPPPAPTTDIAIAGVSAPATVTQGSSADVVVTVRNVGNQDVSAAIDVTLRDATDAAVIGTQSVAGLEAGATATLTFGWNTTGSAIGSHMLTAAHGVTDDDASNNERSTTVTVEAPGTPDGIHIGDLDAITSNDGSSWSATVEITVHDANHVPLNGATVTGSWSVGGLSSNVCTTGDLGGNGSCIVFFPGLRKNVRSVTFTVNQVMRAGSTYQQGSNHDPDGDSNGTSIRVNKP